jgi:L-ascorbate metabolism protein UlaG (beta-lactamase superfamily)
MFLALFFLTAGVVLMIGVGYFISAPRYNGPISDHFDGKKFFNPNCAEPKGLTDVFKWLLTRKQAPWEKIETAFGPRPAERIDSAIRVTFVNHTTFLLQLNGLNILTDPVWSERASPFQWAGPKRMRPPGIRLEDLPSIDIILLSHNHYDHLDLPTLKKIHEKFQPKIFTGLGVSAFLKNHGINNSFEMDWWQQERINDGIQLQVVPAQHFSGRGMFDSNATLWMGFVIKMKEGNILFAADTAYNETMFRQIGERCSPVLLSIIPIGAYIPRWFMSPVHCSPDEAVKIHLHVQSKQSIGSHFGTFPLADEGREQPIIDLKKALHEMQVPENKFIVLKEGTWIDY